MFAIDFWHVDKKYHEECVSKKYKVNLFQLMTIPSAEKDPDLRTTVIPKIYVQVT
jgi:hypothetical protein